MRSGWTAFDPVPGCWALPPRSYRYVRRALAQVLGLISFDFGNRVEAPRSDFAVARAAPEQAATMSKPRDGPSQTSDSDVSPITFAALIERLRAMSACEAELARGLMRYRMKL
jgi:hypothetical protein